ncbi:NAD(P)-binding domain-containing protein [Longimicrobium terrae]|uniref:Cation diffusion facilitator CzcD-associated flavoprotein CzcO n=1 Tax=Longimicrobium terrae TaxID=1639882 RepID=A0A841GQP5_9BACT|nr:cation diffusion facilitator CzcD-associated flavoprotein CzcO [Longimicrobium terrae]MBB6069842.1 cation diffusion facilitator CzcD-associated flavoprotein CzcO [Longimicrobium terrae]
MAGTAMRTGIIIIGSGFSGLGMAIRLRQEGRDDFVVLERAGDVGGTWRDNTYPGAACDVQSHLYSFSFAPNPEWSHSFSRQPEIQAYLKRVAEEHGILPHVRFRHEVAGAEWDGAGQVWRVQAGGAEFVAPVLVMAAGALSDPMIPAIPGLDGFRGRAFHSSRWDHSFDLAGKRVAVIGTGASAIQFVPAIQPVVGRLFLFQRTPPWIIPRHDRPLGRRRQSFFRRVPAAQRAVRAGIYLAREAFVFGFRNPRAMRLAQRTALRHLRASVPDPALRRTLTPDFTMGCKRVLLSNDYLPSLTRPNVEVVTDAVAEVRAHSIITRDGAEREVDAIIFGTGFRPTDPPLGPVTRGREGRTLAEAWDGSPRAHLGTTVAGFPNLFILLGPNTGLGHTSVVYMIEAQAEHVIRALRHMAQNGVGALEPRPEAQAAFVAEVDRRMRGTVWTQGGCASWYLDATGRNSTLWPDFTWRFRRRLARFDPAEYRMTQSYAGAA